MKKRVCAIGLAAILLLCAGCGARSSGGGTLSNQAASSGTNSWYDGDMAPGAAEDSLTNAPTSPAGERNSVYQNAGVKLIRRAELSIQTTEFDQAVATLNDLVTQAGGYYESATVYGGSYRNSNANRSGEYVIRVPAEHFDSFRSGAGALGYLTQNTESSEDVGEAYYDAEARLKTQRTKQERLLSLLEQAATMEDIISLENALSEVEYEIEHLTSTLNRYDSLIGYSTINLWLNEVTKVTEEVGETDPLGKKISAGLSASLEGLIVGAQDLLVWLSYHIFGVIFLAVLAVVGVTVGRRAWKKGKAGMLPKQPKDE